MSEGARDRDIALNAVAKANARWFARGVAYCKKLWKWRGTGEDIRISLERDYNDPPPHPNVVGALINYCVKEGILHPTGMYVPMRERSSHARRTPVYRSTNGHERRK